MSAKTVTDEGGTGKDAVLRAMLEAAEGTKGKKGVPKGYKGTQGIVTLSNDRAWPSPKDKKKSDGYDEEEGVDDEGSESSSVKPRNISYSEDRARAPKTEEPCQDEGALAAWRWCSSRQVRQ